MRSLVRAGLVRAQRGNSGGFVLATAATATSVLDVVNAVDPIRRIKGCPLGLAQHREHLCPLHKKLDESMAVIETDFRATCLSALAEAPAVMAAAAVAGGDDAE
jgi:Rrf2 family protein